MSKAKVNRDDLTSLGTDMNDDKDEVLLRLREVTEPILSEIDNDYDEERAVIIIGAKEVNDSKGDYVGMNTYIDVVGDYGVIQEALYAELMELIEEGSPNLFQSIREVIHKIEEELELEPSEPLLSPVESRTLH